MFFSSFFWKVVETLSKMFFPFCYWSKWEHEKNIFEVCVHLKSLSNNDDFHFCKLPKLPITYFAK